LDVFTFDVSLDSTVNYFFNHSEVDVITKEAVSGQEVTKLVARIVYRRELVEL
jgi:hypothetical protein